MPFPILISDKRCMQLFSCVVLYRHQLGVPGVRICPIDSVQFHETAQTYDANHQVAYPQIILDFCVLSKIGGSTIFAELIYRINGILILHFKECYPMYR